VRVEFCIIEVPAPIKDNDLGERRGHDVREYGPEETRGIRCTRLPRINDGLCLDLECSE
jgi:hypothetical protein